MKTLLKTLLLLGVASTLVGCGGSKDKSDEPLKPVSDDSEMFEVDYETIHGVAHDAEYSFAKPGAQLPQKFELVSHIKQTKNIRGGYRALHEDYDYYFDVKYDIASKSFELIGETHNYKEENSTLIMDTKTSMHVGGFSDENGIVLYYITETGFGEYEYLMTNEQIKTELESPTTTFKSEEEIVSNLYSEVLISRIPNAFGYQYVSEFADLEYYEFLDTCRYDLNEDYNESFKLDENRFKVNYEQNFSFDEVVDFGINADFQGDIKNLIEIDWNNGFCNVNRNFTKIGMNYDYDTNGETYKEEDIFTSNWSSDEFEIEPVDISLFIRMA